MADILGHTITLSGGRAVFVGSNRGRPGFRYIAVRNRDGDVLKFMLTYEAFTALNELFTEKFRGPPAGFPYREDDESWVVVGRDL